MSSAVSRSRTACRDHSGRSILSSLHTMYVVGTLGCSASENGGAPDVTDCGSKTAEGGLRDLFVQSL